MPDWIWAAIISLIVSGIGFASIWGAREQEIESLEARQDKQATKNDQLDQHLASDDTQIAIVETKLETIIMQLDALNANLEKQNQDGDGK